ncbi:MAG: phage minor capsid protein [Lentisphaeria bacterium]
MLTPAQLEAMPYEIQQLVDQLEDDILSDMANRLVQTDFDKESFAWQMQKAQELTKTRESIIKIISRKTGVMESTIEDILKFSAVESLSFDAAIYSMAGLNPLPIVRSPGFQMLLRAGIENTKGVMKNWTRTTANTATKQFENALDRAYMQVASGVFSSSTAVSRAVSNLAKEGLQSVVYPSGHIDHMDVAARRAVRTGIAQTTGALQNQMVKEMGCDLMEITSHLGARPSHAAWQGKIVSLSGKPGYLTQSDIGYGTGAGFKGWNCRHDWYPYIEGISFRSAENFDLEENREVYEATQKQRELERKVRAGKRACLADQAALDGAKTPEEKAALTDQLKRDGMLLKERENKYSDFTKSYLSRQGGKMTLNPVRREVDGFDKVMAKKIKEMIAKEVV